jgi:hypothetical protein
VARVSYAVRIIIGRFKPGEREAFCCRIDEDGQVLLKADLENLRRLVDDDGIMVLDPGHPGGMSSRVEETLDILLGEKACKKIIQVLDDYLRVFLKRDFFVKRRHYEITGRDATR